MTRAPRMQGEQLLPKLQLLHSLLKRQAQFLHSVIYPLLQVSILIYDHALSFLDEIELIWFNTETSTGNRIAFLVNRYLTEIFMVFAGYVMSGSNEKFTTRSSFISRLYTLWDRRQAIKWILAGAFTMAIMPAMAFAILAALQAQTSFQFNTVVQMCLFSSKGWALQFMLGSLSLLDLFVIAMTIVNGFHRPYQRQADVMVALQRDGAFMFIGLFFLRLVNFFMTVFGDIASFAVTVEFVWAMCSIVTSRVQLRVERLRFIRYTHQPGEDVEDFELNQSRLAWS
ncbi:hypothetical protein C8F01DRAFT_1345541 [Mycena amicta]|nr:hypothetical protein C8F01DRAFT_1345541 [Mycena amicta]